MNISSNNFIRSLVRAWAFALVLTLGLGFSHTAQSIAYAGQEPGQEHGPQLPSPSDLSRAFINVAKQVKPAVVSLDVVEKTRQGAMRLPEGFPQIPGLPETPRRREGKGSGVIISPEGYILTNNHVAGDAESIKVKVADGREFKASLVGADPETDLAVIKIEAQNLPFARLGDSEKLEQGEWVIALGSPFGFQQTMTAGIVSATGREIQGAGQFTNFIQTDASINPGNSGGPLVNMKGEVVGINTMIFSRTGGSVGIGFAIPSGLANKVYAQLIERGKVTRGYLGVYLGEVTPAIARTVNYKGETGVLVQDVSKDDGPAAKAGLQSGDVIVEFDGKPVKSSRQLTEIVADTPVGKTVQLKYAREGRFETATIKLGERPRSDNTEPEEDEDEGEEDAGKLGISTQTVTPLVASQLKLKIKTGTIIRSIQPDGPAAEAGLLRGDVIHRINRIPVTNAQELAEALKTIKGDNEIVLQIERGGQLSFITVALER
ncbi:MAG: trypsin-like peptidase domain-containing protein [Blastocatellia bacterium]|nr:trypsin-like peptidase domain-containing protein [Blastocatellia bacterium]